MNSIGLNARKPAPLLGDGQNCASEVSKSGQRLRERFIKSGLAGLADYEVVELLLTLAVPRPARE